ncbi:MAG TPA: mycofactocin precursor MftA [Acidimicrobiales bacterium]|nr:mycofactocin precursor MftA [Acidimicrobiales bacterium]
MSTPVINAPADSRRAADDDIEAPAAEAPTDAVLLEAPTDAVLVEEELLVEEISIDGMCGVY